MYSQQSRFTMVSKKKVKKLKHLLVKGIYYKLLNTSYIFTYNAWIYCKCDQFQGCRLEECERSYCFLCHVRVSYHSGRIKNLKKIADIINNYVEIKNDIQLCVNFDPLCENFWFYQYKTRWRNHFGICKWIYLKNYIGTFDIFCKILIEDF